MGKDTPRKSPIIGEMPRACGHRCAIGNNMLFAARVDIDVYDASGNIVQIAGKSEFPMLRKKRQYRHRNGDDCVTSIFSNASKIGTVLNVTTLRLSSISAQSATCLRPLRNIYLTVLPWCMMTCLRDRISCLR
ncbi:hypothetical protein AVEN_140946-1 [Araneus ventricosus]|uniref:Uncharacterized protein n=1 Tax=Araneus ventricosus TaxID=182803 RepID=A0A4Y2GB45_ARAVE|nr:hypothetical protein AVEN_140946-1 [Araneus ventricosus]